MIKDLFLLILVCNAHYMTSTGAIRSPGFPNDYPSDQHCIYKITVPKGQQIMLNISFFDLEDDPECRYDFLEIR